MPDRTLLLSLRPEFAEKVFDGTKKVDLPEYDHELKFRIWSSSMLRHPCGPSWAGFE
jgi:hypothetical protein